MIKASVQLLISALLVSTFALAGKNDTKQCPNDGKDYQECKLARKSDKGASKYLLTEAGQLSRITDDNGVKCALDQDVIDFKVSQHPNDAAVLYYVKKSSSGEKLMIVNNTDGDAGGQCVKAVKKELMDGVKEYSVVSNQHTTIVNANLGKNGLFQAWDDQRVVYQDNGIVDYQMNPCFGAEGKAFSSYAIFTIDTSGIVTKVKGLAGGSLIKDASDSSRFNTLKEFTQARGVCK